MDANTDNNRHSVIINRFFQVIVLSFCTNVPFGVRKWIITLWHVKDTYLFPSLQSSNHVFVLKFFRTVCLKCLFYGPLRAEIGNLVKNGQLPKQSGYKLPTLPQRVTKRPTFESIYCYFNQFSLELLLGKVYSLALYGKEDSISGPNGPPYVTFFI